ncbi:hypothetical protein NSK_006464 [Nannochloropsis salina CCMP1776]|uniref:60S acidic ribosomal protein P1 n=1 Tax=Nannochloropsis salina CCMP1776 TaxID=1027361 RepID=A0A4D9CXG4_9STRA|nr:hypothetical protein NSK_006464 [Nannochloropsis salina CCMP1776]|eukprot:TFJ82135.1 hypothetical protein NSK_006464 [Nannochloropsis salina CCMP1776]
MSLAELSPAQKEEMVLSLSALLLQDSGVDMSAENLDAVIKASGNTVAAYYPALYASLIEKAGGKLDKFMGAPGAGGGGGGGAGAPAAAAAEGAAPEAKKEKKEEEEEADLGAGNMFGGDGY